MVHSLSFTRWLHSRRVTAIFLLGLFLVATLIVWQAPAEATLGNRIKYVYVHVALIWTATAGFVGAAVLGAVVVITASRPLHGWMQVTGRVATTFFALSAAVSLAASQANWGAIAWNEPRTNVILTVLALAVIIQVVNGWWTFPRLNGLLNLLLPFIFLFLLGNTPLELHPENPIGTSEATGIRFTFYGLATVSLLASLWLIAHLALRSAQTALPAGQQRGE